MMSSLCSIRDNLFSIISPYNNTLIISIPLTVDTTFVVWEIPSNLIRILTRPGVKFNILYDNFPPHVDEFVIVASL